MNLVSFLLIVLGVLLNAMAQLALKASVSHLGAIPLDITQIGPVAEQLLREHWLWVGLSCYAISLVVWLLALSRVDVGIAYPMLSIGYVVNVLAAWAWLGENLDANRLAGIGIILLGVYVLARS
jgi:multidrug transporter EmrE-like cation transporter